MLGKDTSFCAYDSVSLVAGKDYARYSWNTGSHLAGITVHKAGMYWVNATDTNGCAAIDTLVVKQVYRTPVVDLGKDRNLCSGNDLVLDAGKYAVYQWQDGLPAEYYPVTIPGTYWVQVTDNNHCTGSDTVLIKDIVLPPSDFLNSTDSICQYGHLVIAPKEYFKTYAWSTGGFQSNITVELPGMYMLTVVDSNGCTGKDTIQVFKKDCMAGVFIPNAFTPNANQSNNVFRALVYGNVVSFRLQVYSRFGELVFSSGDPFKGWDGRFKGKPEDPATFVWLCSYHLEGSIPMMQKGTVILMH